MQFLPTNLSPDNVGISASVDNTFSWTVNGDLQVSFQLKIYKLLDNTLIYDSTKITSTTPSHIVPSGTLTANVEYYWLIRVYKDDINYIDSEYVYIKCLSSPIVTMNVPALLTTQSATFTATYSQTENIPYNKWKMVLYNNDENTIVDSDWQYNYNISYSFDGFETGATYKVETITESSYGLIATSGKQSFSVTYDVPENTNYFNAQVMDDEGGIKVLWTNLIQIIGTTTGITSFVTGKFGQGLQIDTGGTLVFQVDIPEDNTTNYYCKLGIGFNGDLISFDDELFIGFDGTYSKFYIRYFSNYVYGEQVITPTGWFLIGITPTHIVIANRQDEELVTTTRNSIALNPLQLINPVTLDAYTSGNIVSINTGETDIVVPDGETQWFEISDKNILRYEKVIDIIEY